MKQPMADERWRWPAAVASVGMRLWTVAAGSVRTALPGGGSRRRTGERHLEDTPSRVAFTLYAGRSGLYAEDDGPHPPGRPVDDPAGDFGFPIAPAIAGIDPAGTLFDTTVSTVTPDDKTIHYHLHFGGRTRPYSLIHEGGGTYRSRGGMMDFEWSDRERFQRLDAFLEQGRSYRVVVRDVVQLYEPGGPFDWSVTRADFFDLSDDTLSVSLLYVVWDEDGPENDPETEPRGDPGVGVDDDDGPRAPSFPEGQTPTVAGDTIHETALALIAAGAATEAD